MNVSTKQQQIAPLRAGFEMESIVHLERNLPSEEPDALTALVRICGGAALGNQPLYPISLTSTFPLTAHVSRRTPQSLIFVR